MRGRHSHEAGRGFLILAAGRAGPQLRGHRCGHRAGYGGGQSGVFRAGGESRKAEPKRHRRHAQEIRLSPWRTHHLTS